MVFVPVQRRRRAIEPTREEAALLRDLVAKGVRPEAFESALAGRGVDPERARLLAGLVRPRSAAERLAAIGTTLFWMGLAMAYAIGERPLRHWLREHHPGSEWMLGLVFPLIVVMAVLMTVVARRRAACQGREAGVTRADQIENKPIG